MVALKKEITVMSQNGTIMSAKKHYYAGIMLDAPSIVSCSKFCRHNVSTSTLDGMLVHRRITPRSNFAGTHLYTWVERGTMRVKCLAQEDNKNGPGQSSNPGRSI